MRIGRGPGAPECIGAGSGCARRRVLRRGVAAAALGLVFGVAAGCGYAEESAALGRGPQRTLPRTSLTYLVLTGVVMVRAGATVNARDTFALIAAGAAPQRPYRIGDRIAPDAVLQAAYPEGVVIARDRRMEWLELDGVGGADTPSKAAARTLAAPAAPGPSESPADTPPARSVSRLHTVNPQFWEQCPVSSRAAGGFAIKHVQPDSVCDRLGLVEGDVLDKLNGQDLASMADVIRFYRETERDASAVQLEVLRQGDRQTLRLNR